jgi:hypothetical protein
VREGMLQIVRDLFSIVEEIVFLEIEGEKIRPQRVRYEDIKESCRIKVITRKNASKETKETKESSESSKESSETSKESSKESSETKEVKEVKENSGPMEISKWKSAIMYSKYKTINHNISPELLIDNVYKFEGVVLRGNIIGSYESLNSSIKSEFKYSTNAMNMNNYEINIDNERLSVNNGKLRWIASFDGIFKYDTEEFQDSFVLGWLLPNYQVHRLLLPVINILNLRYIVGEGKNAFGKYIIKGIDVNGHITFYRIYVNNNNVNHSNHSSNHSSNNNSNNNNNNVNHSNHNVNHSNHNVNHSNHNVNHSNHNVNHSNHNVNHSNHIELRNFFTKDGGRNGKVIKKGLNESEVKVLSSSLSTSLVDLKSLIFPNDCLDDEAIIELSAKIVQHPNLEVLDIHRNKKIYEKGLPYFLHNLSLSGNKKLKVLDMNYISTSCCAREIGDVIRNCGIEVLDMSYSTSKLPVLQSIRNGFEINQSLRSLNLNGNYGFGIEGVNLLGEMINHESGKLSSLSLLGCKLDSSLIEVLSTYLEHNRSLVSLSLGRNEIGNNEKVLIKLINSLCNMKKLESIDLSHNKISNDNLIRQLIHSIPTLKEVIVSGNSLDPRVVLEIQRGCNVKIVMDLCKSPSESWLNPLDVLAEACNKRKREDGPDGSDEFQTNRKKSNN